MPRTHTSPPASPRPIPVELACPSCSHELSVPPRQLRDGETVLCGFCGAEPMLMREHDEVSGHDRWVLVDDEYELGDGEE